MIRDTLLVIDKIYVCLSFFLGLSYKMYQANHDTLDISQPGSYKGM